jgi:hypothetical protein
MADICDLAQDHYEKMMTQTMANAATMIANRPEVIGTGYCLSCDEPLPKNGNPRFCDASCRDDYDLRNKKHRL